MTEPARVGKYSKIIRELQEGNQAMQEVFERIITERDDKIIRLRSDLERTKDRIAAHKDENIALNIDVLQLRANLERARKALEEIVAANKEFRAGMPKDWDGDPLQDAIDAANFNVLVAH